MDTIVDACVQDAVRLAIAAFESAAAPEANANPRSCAWQFVKYYYAAYFAANALMRLGGHACINLTAIDCASINGWALAHGVGGGSEKSKLAAGLYYLELNTAKTPTFQLRLAGGKGGVHIQFWSGFIRFLDVLQAEIMSGPAPKIDRDAATSDIDLLRGDLQRNGLNQGSWLSEVRNAVNYRFEHGAWFPYSLPEVDKATLRTSFRACALQTGRYVASPQSAHELVKAVRSCGYLVGWLRHSIETMQVTARGEKRNLIVNGALEFAGRI